MPNCPFKSVDSFWRVKRKQKYPESMLTHCAQIFPACSESAHTDSKLRGERPLSKKYLQACGVFFFSFTSAVPSAVLLMQESFISLFICIICVRRGILWPRNKNRTRLTFSKTKAKRKKPGRFQRGRAQENTRRRKTVLEFTRRISDIRQRRCLNRIQTRELCCSGTSSYSDIWCNNIHTLTCYHLAQEGKKNETRQTSESVRGRVHADGRIPLMSLIPVFNKQTRYVI